MSVCVSVRTFEHVSLFLCIPACMWVCACLCACMQFCVSVCAWVCLQFVSVIYTNLGLLHPLKCIVVVYVCLHKINKFLLRNLETDLYKKSSMRRIISDQLYLSWFINNKSGLC